MELNPDMELYRLRELAKLGVELAELIPVLAKYNVMLNEKARALIAQGKGD